MSLASAFPVVSTVSGMNLYAIVQYATRALENSFANLPSILRTLLRLKDSGGVEYSERHWNKILTDGPLMLQNLRNSKNNGTATSFRRVCDPIIFWSGGDARGPLDGIFMKPIKEAGCCMTIRQWYVSFWMKSNNQILKHYLLVKSSTRERSQGDKFQILCAVSFHGKFNFTLFRISQIKLFKRRNSEKVPAADISTNTPGGCGGADDHHTRPEVTWVLHIGTAASPRCIGDEENNNGNNNNTKVIRGRASQQDNQLVYKQRSSAEVALLCRGEKALWSRGAFSVRSLCSPCVAFSGSRVR
ncbi:hypothetical protein RRG08_036077 [Elysia crispata]|uniref:Uncharacterized protein n=1 Tax=Elysia crispata TaxID=231223 RepID=A0AAE1AKU9_9GAST|nr:hypothetical protein RRG08_036077 [Elysia crispata]